MIKKSFVLTESDIIKSAVMFIFAVLLFGLPGLIMMMFLHWITRQSYAREPQEKHGISHVGASRLGGATIFLFVIIFIALTFYASIPSVDVKVSSMPVSAWIAVILCSTLGLVEDIQNNSIPPKIRLLAKLIIFSILVVVSPSFIPIDLNLLRLDAVLSAEPIGLICTVIFCVGFINGVNMADGANGLMPGVLTAAFGVYYLLTKDLAYAALMTSCGLFTIFNVISGRLFLGDTGAYGLGALAALGGLDMFNRDVVAAEFLAVLFAYPCIDLMATVVRRFTQKRSIFLPDNDHLHNRIHFHCQQWFTSKTMANSLTGISVVFMSAGFALIGWRWEWLSVTDVQWIWIFLVQIILYVFAFLISGFGRVTSQYAVR